MCSMIATGKKVHLPLEWPRFLPLFACLVDTPSDTVMQTLKLMLSNLHEVSNKIWVICWYKSLSHPSLAIFGVCLLRRDVYGISGINGTLMLVFKHKKYYFE